MKRHSKDKGMKTESRSIKSVEEVNNKLGPPSVFVCPECNGPLWEVKEGNALLYRCLVGHAYAPEHFFVAQYEELERALWIALRTIEERAELHRQVAERAKRLKQSYVVKQFSSKVQESTRQAKLLRDVLNKL